MSPELQNNWIGLLVGAFAERGVSRIAQITKDDAVGWFEHCGLFV